MVVGSPARRTTRTALVIGYGNTLRGDDAVGPRVADAVAAWRRPEVRALAVQQLTPELAEAVAGVGLVVFVDATSALDGGEVIVRRLEPADSSVALGHASDPRQLLSLARTLYGSSPPAWWVLVPSAGFELGAGLSALATRGLDAALKEISVLLGRQE
jgi:hydrogenase maturation protease